MSAAPAERTERVEHSNSVRLVGRVAAEPFERELPSGDLLLQWRVVVDRSPAERRVSKVTTDTIDCFAARAAVRRAVGAWQPGDVVEVEGALRRRFWRGANGAAQSRYDVEARVARRLARLSGVSRRRRRG